MSVTQDTTQDGRTDTKAPNPAVSRRQVMKASGWTVGLATVGAGSMHSELGPVGRSEAIGCGGVCIGVAAFVAGGVVVGGAQRFLLDGGGTDVDESMNSEDYVYQIARTIQTEREFDKGIRTQMHADFVDAPEDDSAYAQMASDLIVNRATLAVMEGRPGEAQQDATNALNKQTTRSIINLIESWNSAVLRLVESGALVEAIEADTNQFDIYAGEDGVDEPLEYVLKPQNVSEDSNWSVNEDSIPETDDSENTKALVASQEVPSDAFPYPPTDLEGRSDPVEIHALSMEWYQHYNSKRYGPYWIGPNINALSPGFNNYNLYDEGDNDPLDNTKDNLRPLRVSHPSLEQVTAIDNYHWTLVPRIMSERQTLLDQLPDVVNETVGGLQQGAIEPSQILDARDLLTEFDKNNSRQAMAREMMSIGADFPGEVSHQAKISHPDLEAEELWCDLYLRLADGVDEVDLSTPQTLSADQYRLAWIGFTDQVTGEYTRTGLDGNEPLEILQVETSDDQTRGGQGPVEDGGDVPIGDDGAENLPEPIASDDPKYDDWNVVVRTPTGETATGKIGDLIREDGTWKLPTDLDKGEGIEDIRISPPVQYEDTGYDATDASEYDPEKAKETMRRRREFNDAVDEQFNSGIGGGIGDGVGGLGNIPTIPGMGLVGTLVVAILGLFGLNAATSN